MQTDFDKDKFERFAKVMTGTKTHRERTGDFLKAGFGVSQMVTLDVIKDRLSVSLHPKVGESILDNSFVVVLEGIKNINDKYYLDFSFKNALE